MKHSISMLFILPLFVITCQIKTNKFDILLEPQWKDLDANKKKIYFDDKWILAGNITFKKTAPDEVTIQEIDLSWKGEKIQQIVGSLYEKEINGTFMPIEKFHICDSVWKQSEQKLILKFKKPKKLSAINTLCLVLTIPKDTEKKIKEGSFFIEISSLPQPYQTYVAENNLTLTLSNNK